MRVMRLKTALVAVPVFACMPFTVAAETLRDVLSDTYYYSPSLEGQRAQLRALGEDISIAKAGRLPTVNLDSSLGVSRDFNNFNSTGTSTPLSMGFNGSLPLYDGGQAANQVSQARATVDSASATLRSGEQQLLLNATIAFFDVLRDEEIRDLTRENLRLLREELVASETRFEVGEVTLTDVAQTKSRVAGANSNVVQADGNLRISAETFRNIVGRLPQRLEPPEFLPRIPETMLAAETEAVANDPSIVSARAAERAAVYAIRAAMSGNLPDVTLQSSITGRVNDPLENDNANFNTQLTLSLRAPVYQGGATDSRVRRARHVASQRRAEYHAAVRNVQQEVTTSWNQLLTARGAIEAGEERVKAAEIAFMGVKEELLVGSRATIDVLNAEQERLDARIALVRAVRDLNTAAYRLLAAMGRFDPVSFGLEPAPETGEGLHGVEPKSIYGIPDTASTTWRFPWRP